MSASIRTYLTQLLPVVVVAFTFMYLYIVSGVVYAQEEVSANDTSSEIIPTPYEVEALLGNEVYGDFVVGPGKIELTIEPGQSKTIEITVSNRTGVSRIFEINAEDATSSSDPTQNLVLLGDDRGPYSLKDYVSVQTKRFELPHNQRARIPVTITLPADAEPGGLYGSVLISTVSSEAKADPNNSTAPQSAVVARIGTLFFITIPGDVELSGTLKDFGTVPPQRFFQEGPVRLGVLYENTGKMYLTPYGEISITNMFGEEVGTIALDPWFVLPQSIRLREVSWNREFLFGRYTATIAIQRNYDDVVEEMSFVFWVLPWKPLASIFGFIFLVLFLIRTFFKKFEFKRKDQVS